MPTYEYECRKCEHRFEVFQSIKETPRKICPECGGRVRRLLGTGAGVLFKGSGFHATDYRKPSYKEAAKKDSGGTPAPASSGKPASSGSGTSKE
jgi:putative FmdB family regulatory protein